MNDFDFKLAKWAGCATALAGLTMTIAVIVFIGLVIIRLMMYFGIM